MKTRIKLISLVTVLVLLGTGCSTINALTPNSAAAAAKPQQTAPTAVPMALPANIPQNGVIAAYEGTLEEIYQRVNPSVVNIRVVQKNMAMDTSGGNLPQLPFFNFPNQPQQPNPPQYSEGLGSGFVWDTEGHIVTNNHVVDGADKIQVTFADGTVLPAKLVGADSYSDLAVIQVDPKSMQLQPIEAVDSNSVKVGQLAIAIGNPFGLSGTMTVGVVSALGRTIPAGDVSNSQGPVYSIPDIIQTDAPINPGNSGGVLLNDQGQLIGVTAAIESTVGANAGIGFAIPSAIVQRVVPALIKTGSYQHPFLGISGTTLTLDMAKAMNLPENTHGALVVEVIPNGPADKAGLKGSDRQVIIDGQDVRVGGDVIIKIDDTVVHTMDDVIAYLSDHTEVGQTVKLTVLRDGKEKVLNVKLEARPNTQNAQSNVLPTQGVWMGISAIPLNAEIDKALHLPENTRGLLIQQVESGSPADQAGLRGGYKPLDINGEQIFIGGDILIKVDGTQINTVAQLQRWLADKKAGDQITLTILRDGKEQEVTLTLAEKPAQNP
ncbi:MAG: PDZ domain-containing protein [Anaerolineales bacterium]